MIRSAYVSDAKFHRAWATNRDHRANLGEITFIMEGQTYYATIDEAVAMNRSLQDAIVDYYEAIRDEATAIISGAMTATSDHDD